MKTRLYLDTSVLSLLDDDRSPERRDLTREFWVRRGEFDLATSEITRQEIMETGDAVRREAMLAALADVRLLPLAAEQERLAATYVARGIFPPTVLIDALHVAVAVLTDHDVVVSWNFKHMVNQRRRAMIQQLNQSLGLRTISLLPPPEV